MIQFPFIGFVCLPWNSKPYWLPILLLLLLIFITDSGGGWMWLYGAFNGNLWHIGTKIIAYNPRRRCTLSVSGVELGSRVFMEWWGHDRTGPRSADCAGRGWITTAMTGTGAKPDPLPTASPYRMARHHPPTPKQTEPSTETPRNPAPQSNGLTCTRPSSTPEREIQSNNFGSYMPNLFCLLTRYLSLRGSCEQFDERWWWYWWFRRTFMRHLV